MLLRVTLRSLTIRPGRRALAAVAVALGTSVVLALVAVASDIGDRVARELRAGGANIALVPASAAAPVALPGGTVSVPLPGTLLAEKDVPQVLTTFWANNIVALSPVLELEAFVAPATDPVLLVGTTFDGALRPPSGGQPTPMGLRRIAPYASVDGRLPADGAPGEGGVEAAAGVALARKLDLRPGRELELSVPAASGAPRPLRLRIVGTISTGGEEDERLYAPLRAVQEASGRVGLVSKVLVSAVLAPEDRLYERAMKDLGALSRSDYELFMCRAYPGPVARDLAKPIPSAEGLAMLRTADAEGAIVTGMRYVTVSAAAAVVVSAALAVFAALATSIVERRHEVGLLKAIGAARAQVLAPFLAETAVTGLLGGIAGFALGAGLARLIGQQVFGRPETVPLLLFLPSLAVAMALALAGSLVPLVLIARLDPAIVLRGES